MFDTISSYYSFSSYYYSYDSHYSYYYCSCSCSWSCSPPPNHPSSYSGFPELLRDKVLEKSCCCIALHTGVKESAINSKDELHLGSTVFTGRKLPCVADTVCKADADCHDKDAKCMKTGAAKVGKCSCPLYVVTGSRSKGFPLGAEFWFSQHREIIDRVSLGPSFCTYTVWKVSGNCNMQIEMGIFGILKISTKLYYSLLKERASKGSSKGVE